MTNEADVTRRGATLVAAESGRWLAASDISNPIVVFIHGFTSHGGYLSQISEYAQRNGFNAALFNYDSYLGIDRAAEDLATRLTSLRRELERFGYALVGHSMGGLVARLFAMSAADEFKASLRGLALLGTPNAGVLGDSRLLAAMLAWGEALTGPNPFARSRLCRAAEQLTMNDRGRLIERLNLSDSTDTRSFRVLSISGGRRYLEFGRPTDRFLGNALRNRLVQRLLHHQPNDGLVPESSSNLVSALGTQEGSHRCVHQNAYGDYARTNHTYLTQNQEIGVILIEWLREVFPSASSDWPTARSVSKG